jgi:hypothetical protein
MFLDDGLGEPQAQTGADVFLGRIEGFEYFGAMRLTDSTPIVTDADPNAFTTRLRPAASPADPHSDGCLKWESKNDSSHSGDPSSPREIIN